MKIVIPLKGVIICPAMKLNSVPVVALNAHLLSGDASYRSAGISAYLFNLFRHLNPQEDALRYVLFMGRGKQPGINLPVSSSLWATDRPAARILWEQLALPWALHRVGANLLHAPAFVGPLWSSCPQVITVHDLSFLRHPEFFRGGNRFYLQKMTGVTCRRAAAVVAVSEFTAREVVALLGIPRERIHVIYHGVDPVLKPLPAGDVARFRLERELPERFILYLGTLEPRKNLPTLVQAFARLKDPALHLVLAGGRGWLYETIFAEVERLGLTGRVHFPGYISPQDQVYWYNAATAFAYISHYEGFGLPVLEALACGTPTLAAETTALPEAAGDAAVLVPPTDVTAVAEGLHRVLTDAGLRDSLRCRGPAHAARFSWSETARQTVALYHQILGDQGKAI